jgi:hypothetical protein
MQVERFERGIPTDKPTESTPYAVELETTS